MPFLTIDDMGGKYWIEMFKRTRHPCFDLVEYPAFPKDQRVLKYNKDIFFMPTDACLDDCSNNEGLCVLGRCTCKNGKHGESCEKLNCFNSLVFVDVDTIDVQQRMHCS